VDNCEVVQAAADLVAAIFLPRKHQPKQRWRVSKPYCWQREAVRHRNRQQRRSRLHGRPARYGKS